MIIRQISWRNFKSYGNALQSITFSDDGEFILLNGQNGNGKSSIKEVIEFVLFGKCSGRRNKRLNLNELPNRINRNLFTDIKFENAMNDKIYISRSIAPKGFEMKVNEMEYIKEFKTMTEEQRENFIGFSYDVFKSFVFMSLNDF